MAISLTNFDLMWQAYPNPGGEAEDAKSTIGGNADADWIENTCVIRMSRSFNYSGQPIPKRARGLSTVSGRDGMRYAFRVREFRAYLRRNYGQPTLYHKYAEPGGDVPGSFRGRQGMIAFIVDAWIDATGHLDLWDGARCVHHGYFEEANEVELWEVGDLVPGSPRAERGLPSLPIADAVGEGAANRTADVVIVQTLMAENSYRVGPIDGKVGVLLKRAIVDFQASFLSQPDGRIDPKGNTWRKLNGL